ncbi:uncharacterized protein LOC107264880 isoform X1 [Cephus cinctus]|uniref:Uncharacterized protein LOC107264880 isoform X1 n=1 Tax=Cephus cinctus TaxID=211228 RepID=A0AAJ7BLK4_CEPCN|nr:uncharacterized protein LOC107264880 isoform X1 [Cephus cinctus]
MLFQNSQLIVMLVLILTVYQIHSTRQHRSSTKPNFKFAPASNRRYRKLENQEASIDVGNVISIVIPNNPHEMLNVEQLTEDFRNELERIKKQSSVKKFQHGLITLRKVLPELSPEEKRKALPWLRKILKMKQLEGKNPTNKNRRDQDSNNDNIDNKDNEDFENKQQINRGKHKSIRSGNTERKDESDDLDSEEPEVAVTESPRQVVENYSISPIITQPPTPQTYIPQDYNSPPMSEFVTPADYIVNHNFPAVSSFKNGGPVGLFKVLNQPLYDETDKRQKNIPKEVRIPKSTSSNENLEVVAERDAFKDADFDRNARLVNDLARIAEQLANFRANENPPAGYLDQLTPSARNDLAAAAAQPLNINSSEDLRSNASVVVNEPKRLPEISADLIVYDYVPNKDTNDKRNGFYLPS